MKTENETREFTQGSDGGIYINGIKLTIEQIREYVELENIKDFNEENYCLCYGLPTKNAIRLDVLIATEFKTQVDNIYSGSRCRSDGSAPARQMYLKVAKDFTCLPLSGIGKLVKTPKSPKGLSHSDVIHACKAVRNDIDTNGRIREIHNRIVEKINKKQVLMP